MTNRILSVGLRLPGDSAEYVPLRSGSSLFDGDVILFCPHFDDYTASELYAGLPLLAQGDSAAVIKDIAHWRAEIKAAAESGKIVFVYLRRPVELYYHTGDKSFSGTGRSRITTLHVNNKSSYDMLPVTLPGLTPRSGKEMSIVSPLGPLSAYWSEFGALSAYQAYYESGVGTDLIGTKRRERVVASLIRTGDGALVLLPSIEWDEEALTYLRGQRQYWRKEAQRLGTRWIHALTAASNALRKSAKKSPTPEWVE